MVPVRGNTKRTGRQRLTEQRFEWHCTSKLGSWLDMAESELDVLSAQCLDRRIPNKPRRSKKSPPRWPAETRTTPRQIGSSPQPMPGRSSRGYTRRYERLGPLVPPLRDFDRSRGNAVFVLRALRQPGRALGRLAAIEPSQRLNEESPIPDNRRSSTAADCSPTLIPAA
jgi:hypothetical protein